MKAVPGKTSGFLVMISCIYILSIYGEPYSSSGYIGVTGYTGRYLVWFLVSILVCYYLWVGVQLPQGKYVSYGRGYLVVSVSIDRSVQTGIQFL